MSIQDETRDAELKSNRAKLERSAKEIPADTNRIKEGLESLQSNVVGLAHNIQVVGTDKAQMAADYVRDRVSDVKALSANSLEKAESRIRAKPTQSVAIAFGVGILASYLLRRRS